MAVRETLQIGDERLKAKNKKVGRVNDSEIKRVIKDGVDTMRENQLIGLAAPQIGENYRLFVTEPRQTKFRTADQTDILRVYINPEITWFSTEQVEIYEGCGSFARGTLFGPVTRPRVIEIKYMDEQGKTHNFKCDGILARVIQHEYDHLSGIEFIEKMSDYRKLIDAEIYRAKIKDLPQYLQASLITIKEER